MAQNDHLPLVFKFAEANSKMEEIENKEEWGLMDMAQNELAAAVATPAPVPAPIPAPAPTTIPVALTGWSPSTIAKLEATCVSDLARYIEFLREEEERLVEHTKSLTAAVAAAHADAEARN